MEVSKNKSDNTNSVVSNNGNTNSNGNANNINNGNVNSNGNLNSNGNVNSNGNFNSNGNTNSTNNGNTNSNGNTNTQTGTENPESESIFLHGIDGWRSAFEIIIEKEVKEFADEAIFNDLIRCKWDAFGRYIYLGFVVVPYVSVLVVYIAASLTRVQDFSDMITFSDLLHPTDDSSAHVVYGLAAFQNASGQMFLVLASVGAFFLLCIFWMLVRHRYRNLDQNHDGRISYDELRMFVYKNLCSVSCLVTCGLLEGIVAARYRGQLEAVSGVCVRACVCIYVCIHVCVYVYPYMLLC
jgi:hypothetical protein